jgi:YD repeat-containing protein
MKAVARSKAISVLTASSCRWGAELSNAKEFGTSAATLWKWPAWMRTTAPFAMTVAVLRPGWVVTSTGMWPIWYVSMKTINPFAIIRVLHGLKSDMTNGEIFEETFLGPGGQLEFYEEPYVRVRWQYNPQGKETEVTYFDVADKPVKTRDGYAKITYAYDLHGNQREVAFFDENGQPTARRGGYAKIVRTYDARKNLLEEILLNTEGKPARSEDGYAKRRFAYDARGYRIETTYYDERDGPTADKDGCAKVGNNYNDKGQWTEWACFGTDGSSIVAKKHGFAKARQIFDVGGKLLRVDYFDANDVPARSAKGYARIKYSYDDLGRETKREFFDVDGAPVFTRVTIEKVEPDSKSRRVDLQTGDMIIAYDGQEVADNRRFHELELISGERRRQLTIERAGRILSLDVTAGRLTGLETADKVPAARDKSIAIPKKRPG